MHEITAEVHEHLNPKLGDGVRVFSFGYDDNNAEIRVYHSSGENVYYRTGKKDFSKVSDDELKDIMFQAQEFLLKKVIRVNILDKMKNPDYASMTGWSDFVEDLRQSSSVLEGEKQRTAFMMSVLANCLGAGEFDVVRARSGLCDIYGWQF